MSTLGVVHSPKRGTTQLTDMGWSGEGPWSFQLLNEPHLSMEFDRLTRPMEYELLKELSTSGTRRRAFSVTVQPCPNPEERSQDRHVVESWDVPGGRWTFLGVFDGHAGHDTVDYAIERLPSLLKDSLVSTLASSPSATPQEISDALSTSISCFDQSLADDLISIFPGGESRIAEMSDDDIRALVNDKERGGRNAAILARCMRGSTALVALVDPRAENLWSASLGDCVAVLSRSDSRPEVVSSNHNGADPSEARRVQLEHPGEEEAILRDRVLGALAVTRALGDHLFKLPSIFTTRVFLNAMDSFRFSTPLETFLPRNKTPPYVSSTPSVKHRKLKTDSSVSQETSQKEGHHGFLIMCSDGLMDLSGGIKSREWANVVECAITSSEAANPASALLRWAMGGEDAAQVSRMLTVEMSERWMDDTTIVVLEF